MKNEDFLEMLGSIDDSIVDECAVVPVETKKPRVIKYILSLAAVFLFTICAVLISAVLPDGLLTVGVGEEHTVSDNYEAEVSDFSEAGTSELHNEATVTEEFLSTQISYSSETGTDIESDISSVSEDTTASDKANLPDDTSTADISSDESSPYFVEVPYEKLISTEADGQMGNFTDRKKISRTELLRIYGKIIIPSAFGTMLPEYPYVPDDSHLTISGGKNTAAENLFCFTLPDGSLLDVKASNYKLDLSETEKEYIDFSSGIDGVTVLLLKGCNNENKMVFSAYFEKNGVYFRITQQGTDLSEEEFLDMLKSFI